MFEFVECKLCHKVFQKSLKRHLRSHDISPRQYYETFNTHIYSESWVKYWLDKVFEKQGENLQLDLSTLIYTDYKVRFIDVDYGEWWTLLRVVAINGSCHPDRANENRRKLLTEPIENVKYRLAEIFADKVTIDENTYVNTNTKCRFIDHEFGEWWTLPTSVLTKKTTHPLRGFQKSKTSRNERCGKLTNPIGFLNLQAKRQKTCIEKYGATHHSRNRIVYEKIVSSLGKCEKFVHWKTGNLVLCRGSYEVAFIAWCNKNRINFDWQIPFEMSDGRIYYVDALLLDGEFSNTFIEIKGWWVTQEAKEKWEWFHATYPNSQIWFQKQLKQHGVI